MTATHLPGKAHATIRLDQFVAAPPAKVWRLLTEPELMRLWWAEGEVAAVVGLDADLAPCGRRHRNPSLLGAQRL